MPWKKLLTTITKVIFGLFIIAYPFVIFYALQHNIALKFMGLVLLLAVVFSFISNQNKYTFMGGLTLCFLLILFNQELFLKLYPVLMNATTCAIFALSLHKTPLITQFAQKTTKKTLTQNELTYTRHATIAWSIFMLINTIFSIITIFLSNEIWVWYNGFISYVLIGIMMLSEYIIRKRVIKCSHQ